LAARVFSAGSSLPELAAAAASNDPAARAGCCSAARAVPSAPLPGDVHEALIATLVGPALGSGYALGAHTDYLHATRTSSVAFPEVSQGLVPHGGASYYLCASRAASACTLR